MNTSLMMALTVLVPVLSFAGQGQPPQMLQNAPGVAPRKAAVKRVFFKNLKDGQTVSQNQLIQFGVEGMKVHPAGELIDGTGHHHLIIDGTPTPTGTVVPADDTHIHFGKGQEETTVKLSPGKHTLTLQFANGAHLSYGPEMSTTIQVQVK